MIKPDYMVEKEKIESVVLYFWCCGHWHGGKRGKRTRSNRRVVCPCVQSNAFTMGAILPIHNLHFIITLPEEEP